MRHLFRIDIRVFAETWARRSSPSLLWLQSSLNDVHQPRISLYSPQRHFKEIVSETLLRLIQPLMSFSAATVWCSDFDKVPKPSLCWVTPYRRALIGLTGHGITAGAHAAPQYRKVCRRCPFISFQLMTLPLHLPCRRATLALYPTDYVSDHGRYPTTCFFSASTTGLRP